MLELDGRERRYTSWMGSCQLFKGGRAHRFGGGASPRVRLGGAPEWI